MNNLQYFAVVKQVMPLDNEIVNGRFWSIYYCFIRHG